MYSVFGSNPVLAAKLSLRLTGEVQVSVPDNYRVLDFGRVDEVVWHDGWFGRMGGHVCAGSLGWHECGGGLFSRMVAALLSIKSGRPVWIPVRVMTPLGSGIRAPPGKLASTALTSSASFSNPLATSRLAPPTASTAVDFASVIAAQVATLALVIVSWTLAVVFGMRMSETFNASEPGLSRKMPVTFSALAVVPSMADVPLSLVLWDATTLSLSAAIPVFVARVPAFTPAPAPPAPTKRLATLKVVAPAAQPAFVSASSW